MPEDHEKLRKEAIARAGEASKLVHSQKYFPDLVKAIRDKDKALFEETCAKVGIVDAQLISHMWKVIAAAHSSVYGQQAPSPIW